ncbi:hypothetical protein GYMLUDRAFT_88968 [Collybiopsis luxurians FD-317 M1]|uniref:Uncharacterized protein n=1 Tax=Collybiopsis luxurians FD-317 M1 TaxID=944289 RepID=A0A0D0BPU3_9AGAR|nr:hypothetical protein GYMLUDRAFT_88968 [Collybiopsis luxurians FD-317 M1]
MPVTFRPAKHRAKSISREPSSAGSTDALEFLKAACYDQYQKSDEVLQSSIGTTPTIPASNGFVDAVTKAYNQHHALSIRPDDVWIAILTQFNFYVNANAERLRSHFVEHEGKKELWVTAVGSRYTVDFGYLARLMTGELRKNVKDPSFCDWILPKFTTTTVNDTVVSSVIMMATMKKYFSYGFSLTCGIPQVTLEGTKDDWEQIVERIEKLKDFGEETNAWYKLLFPVLSRFVRAFDDPNGESNLEFWQRVTHWKSGSGPTWLSGWITAFCVFNEDGKWIGNPPGTKVPDESDSIEHEYSFGGNPLSKLTIDEAHYHVLDTKNIPAAYADVDVKLDDNGQEFDTIMVAGLVGMHVCNTGDTTLSETGQKDLLKPMPGWWIFIKRNPDLPGRGDEERRREMEEIMARLDRMIPGRNWNV